jgi:hypothetical protein
LEAGHRNGLAITQTSTSSSVSQPPANLVTDILNSLAALVVIIGGAIALIFWLVRYRPKAVRRSVSEYVDCTKNTMEEEVEFKLRWGRVFFLRRMHLRNISNSSSYRIEFKAPSASRHPLSKDYYRIIPRNDVRELKLVGKSFFVKHEVEKVYLLETGRPDLNYKKKVSCKFKPDVIEVYNENPIEIRNYTLEAPKGLTADRFKDSLSFIQDFQMNKDGTVGAITLRSIPPREGSTPGNVVLVL